MTVRPSLGSLRGGRYQPPDAVGRRWIHSLVDAEREVSGVNPLVGAIGADGLARRAQARRQRAADSRRAAALHPRSDLLLACGPADSAGRHYRRTSGGKIDPAVLLRRGNTRAC